MGIAPPCRKTTGHRQRSAVPNQTSRCVGFQTCGTFKRFEVTRVASHSRLQ